MPGLDQSIVIDADPDDVFATYFDVARWPTWCPTIRAVERLEPGPFMVGSRTRVRQPRLPPAIWTVTALEPGTMFAWESPGPGFVTTGVHRVRAVVAGAEATASLTSRGPLCAVSWWLTRRLVASYLDQETAALRRVFEG